MGKKHKKELPYAVDAAAAGYPDGPRCKRWHYFKTLRKAVRFARANGLTATDIMDQDGNTIPDLNLMAPIFDTAPELLRKLEFAERGAEYAKKVRDQAEAKELEANRRLIRAGLVPLEELRSRIGRDVTSEHMGHAVLYKMTMLVGTTDELGSDIIVKIVNGE